jgi:hypothetical protein
VSSRRSMPLENRARRDWRLSRLGLLLFGREGAKGLGRRGRLLDGVASWAAWEAGRRSKVTRVSGMACFHVQFRLRDGADAECEQNRVSVAEAAGAWVDKCVAGGRQGGPRSRPTAATRGRFGGRLPPRAGFISSHSRRPRSTATKRPPATDIKTRQSTKLQQSTVDIDSTKPRKRGHRTRKPAGSNRPMPCVFRPFRKAQGGESTARAPYASGRPGIESKKTIGWCPLLWNHGAEFHASRPT